MSSPSPAAGEDDGFNDLVNALTSVTACLSMLGALLIVWTFWKSRRIRVKKLRQMLVVLSIFDFVSALGYLLMVTLMPDRDSKSKSKFACDCLALITIFFPGASFVATDGIALYAYVTLVHPSLRHRSSFRSSSTLYIFVAACLIIPGIMTVLIAGLHAEGYDINFKTDTCWINGNFSETTKFEYQVLGGKGLEWFSFIFVLCCYVPTVRKLHSVLRHNVSNQSKDIRRMLFRLALVPGVFICLRLPSAIHTLLMFFIGPNYKYVDIMTAMQSVGDTGQGAANGLLYVVFSDTVHQVFFGGCCRSAGSDENDFRELSETKSTISGTHPSDRLTQSMYEYYESGEAPQSSSDHTPFLESASFDESSS